MIDPVGAMEIEHLEQALAIDPGRIERREPEVSAVAVDARQVEGGQLIDGTLGGQPAHLAGVADECGVGRPAQGQHAGEPGCGNGRSMYASDI